MGRLSRTFNINTRYALVLGLASLSLALDAQQDNEPAISLGGYVKDLQTVILQPDLPLLADQLLHSRVNLDWDAGSGFRVHTGLRTRVFWGDQVKLTPDYGEVIDTEANDYLDLSLLLEDPRSIVFHSYFDRLYLEYAPENWEVRLGRQRINWGINNFWNPNDIFNAFSFVDFDYEERPGADVLRIKHYTGISSSIEIAARISDHMDDAVFGALWKFNASQYDFQVLGAWYREYLTLGGGWAGVVGNAGFKGELSAFIPAEQDSTHEFSVSASIQADYVFANGLYGTAGILFNSLGRTSGSLASLFAFELDARQLYPFKTAVLMSGAYSLSPLLSGNVSVVYSPVEAHPVFFSPSFTYSLATNWDLDLVGQVVFSKEDSGYRSPVQAFFLRLKWSW